MSIGKTTVSIHAPARGATNYTRTTYLVSASFNPRTREGCDLGIDKSTYNLKVSIHAPARGATRDRLLRELKIICFNPRTREGCDSCWEWTARHWLSFNPRTREGCDDKMVNGNPSKGKFQSTHPRGVRLSELLNVDRMAEVSIHAPARGATIIALFTNPVTMVSIHAPARGATLILVLLSMLVMFQSTHPRGVRLFLVDATRNQF